MKSITLWPTLDRSLIVLAVAFSFFFFCGCHILPNIPTLAPITARASAISAGSARTVPVPSLSSSPSHSAAYNDLQSAANWIARCFWIAGLLSLLGAAGCAFLAFNGDIHLILPSACLALAGVCLPIFGTWFAWHWLAVFITVLISVAVAILVTHWTVLKPTVTAFITELKALEGRIAAKV